MRVAAEPLDLWPTRREFRKLAAEHAIVPVAHRFVSDLKTPVSAYLKLRGEGPSFLLESAEQGRLGRWSFIGFRPRSVARLEGGKLIVDGDEEPFDDPFQVAQRLLGSRAVATVPDLPPFIGGVVGMFGYDLARLVEPVIGQGPPDDLGLPDLALMVCDLMVAFDHLRHESTVVASVWVEDDPDAGYDAAEAAIAEVREALRGLVPEPHGRASSGRTLAPPRFVSNVGREGFIRAVERCQEYIRAGDAYQIVPSQRWSADCPVAPFSVYRGLRCINPSPYMYFLDFGDFQLAGASPEPLVTVHGRRVSQRPIAGTRPRAGTAEGDLAAARELLADEKERAEHVMLVDLARNDLGRVSKYGTVRVDELMVVESFSHVMHIVSTVSGELRDGLTAVDALRAVLPAGTLSGAPKIRAMQIIDELEPTRRGPYGGAVGYLSYNGDLDTCICIRTAVIKDGRIHVQAGAGIVADSVPEREVAETEAKARAVIAAVELAARQPELP